MEILVCVKRVPAPGAKIVLTDDGQGVDTRHLGFTVSPHEECAVEEAVQIVERVGGRATVLTLGPPAAEEQLRAAVSMGAERGVLCETAEPEWPPEATAAAITAAVRTLEAEGSPFDLVLFGDESADAGNHQVGIRVAVALDRPVVAGIKGIELTDGRAQLRREIGEGFERYDVGLPAVVAVKEGINLPRYPSLKGRLRARKAEIRRFSPERPASGLRLVRLTPAAEEHTETVILGHGAEAAPRIVDILEEVQ